MVCRYILFLHSCKKIKREGGVENFTHVTHWNIVNFQGCRWTIKDFCVTCGRRRAPCLCVNAVRVPAVVGLVMMYHTGSISALSGDLCPTLRSRVNYLYFSCVLLSIPLLWKPHLTSFLNLWDCSQASVKVNKNIRLLAILLLATSCQQSTNSLAESFETLAWLFMQSIARLVCIHNCLILWPLL